MLERRLLVGAALAATLIGACGPFTQDDPERPGAPTGAEPRTSPARPAARKVPTCRPSAPYEPAAEEQQAAIKRLAARKAQAAVTYGPDATAGSVAASLGLPRPTQGELRGVLATVVAPRVKSCGRVIYPQLSGLTGTTAGVMVAVEQVTASERGVRRQRRVFDVRLIRGPRGWAVERIASAGGTPVDRPATLSPEAKRVLDNPRITLTDSARWDIHRRIIDLALLRAVADAADEQPLSVLVLRTGHPPNVWATSRVSAHTAGRAADIWAVDNVPVASPRGRGPARRLGQRLLAGGAAQLGAPVALGPRSFSDAVHQDHVHVQQR